MIYLFQGWLEFMKRKWDIHPLEQNQHNEPQWEIIDSKYIHHPYC